MATSSAALHTKQRVKTCLSLDKVIVCILLVMIWGASTAPFFIFYFPEVNANGVVYYLQCFVVIIQVNVVTTRVSKYQPVLLASVAHHHQKGLQWRMHCLVSICPSPNRNFSQQIWKMEPP